MPPPPKASTIYSGVVELFGRIAPLGSGKKYGFIRVDETGKEVFVSEAHAPNGWLEKGDRVVFRIIEEENRKGRATAQYKAVDVKLVERVAAEPPIATIDGVAATLNRLQLDAAGTSPLANLTAKTGAVLPHGSLIPNHAAKAMISDFLDEARRHQAALDASMADEVKGAP